MSRASAAAVSGKAGHSPTEPPNAASSAVEGAAPYPASTPRIESASTWRYGRYRSNRGFWIPRYRASSTTPTTVCHSTETILPSFTSSFAGYAVSRLPSALSAGQQRRARIRLTTTTFGAAAAS